MPKLLCFLLISVALQVPPTFADVPLPVGSMSGCPFVHDDAYDLDSAIETLKQQIAAELDTKTSCKSSLQAIQTHLSSIHDFYRTIDVSARERIAQSVYANALSALEARKLQLEMTGDTSSPEYQSILSRIDDIHSSEVLNSIELRSKPHENQQWTEAYYRNQIARYTSNILNAYLGAARDPRCVGSIGGWGQGLTSVIGGFSIAAGLGVNPVAQTIGSVVSAAVQLVNLLQDGKVRAAFNDLIRVKNYKTLACTYYAIKKSSCEYRRALRMSGDVAKLRDFLKNRYLNGTKGEYERFFVNRGRVEKIGGIFELIAKMGSPLTLNLDLLDRYNRAKAVNFDGLGEVPNPETSSENEIKAWLINAKSFGLEVIEIDFRTGQSIPLREQLKSVIVDIANKKSAIEVTEKLLSENFSFLDLRRRMSNDYPNLLTQIDEMGGYFKKIQQSSLVDAVDKGTVAAGIQLLEKLSVFVKVSLPKSGVIESQYEREIIEKGSEIFSELARGSVAQLSRQSVLALSSKGVDRLFWAFGVIRNSYLNRDQSTGTPGSETFAEYERGYGVLADLIQNYRSFSGPGTTFRNEEYSQAVESFSDAFGDDMLRSLELSMQDGAEISELKGKTASHLCALYSPILKRMGGKKSASQILDRCRTSYRSLEMNRLVSDDEYLIDYSNDCTYFDYSREMDLQNLLADLVKP